MSFDAKVLPVTLDFKFTAASLASNSRNLGTSCTTSENSLMRRIAANWMSLSKA